MKLISETIKSKLIEERDNFGWNTTTHHLFNDLIELCSAIKSQEIKNIEEAFRTGWQTQDKWSLNLEIYDHIKCRYDEETMTYDEYEQEKKSVNFFRDNFQDAELLPCNCGKADRCNCHLVDGGNNG